MARPIIPNQSVLRRVTNFDEVAGGLVKNQALDEAARCPQCADPVCMTGCPVKVDIPGFIRALREGNSPAALSKIREENPLTAVCGRICSAPCEAACVLNEEQSPISIQALERFAWESGQQRMSPHPLIPLKDRDKGGAKDSVKISVIGSGPAGLTAAVELAKLGYKVTIIESLHESGGVLSYGVPAFRLPKKILQSELEYVRSLRVEIKNNEVFGQSLSLKELLEDNYKAIFLALGSGVPKFSNIPGENLVGVYYADEFLMRVNLMNATQYPRFGTPLCLGEKIVVIGKGFAALDCARLIVRLGKEISLVHQGLEEDFGVPAEMTAQAKEEGVKLEILTKIIQIVADGNQGVSGLKCVRMDFADPQSSGQWQIMPVEGSQFIIQADTVILAVGHKPNVHIVQWLTDIKLNKNGTVWTPKNSFMTSIDGVFVGGNLVSGQGPMVSAMGQAKEAVREMHEYVQRRLGKRK